jgi:hypothetical protein
LRESSAISSSSSAQNSLRNTNARVLLLKFLVAWEEHGEEIRHAAQTDGRIQIDVDGAIETPEIRKVITHIMEGGKAAFDLRNRKYNFETIAD